jgi:uncharacterized membrane protein
MRAKAVRLRVKFFRLSPGIFISLFSPKRLSLAIIGFGILVRFVQYLYNRSLWADEAVLALNIINRSYLELLQPLDHDQGAPLGFLMVEKLVVQLFGDNEYALRLFPLLSSIIALLLLYGLAKRCIQPPAVPIALALFASLRYLVYYASEVKQYSIDVAITLAVFLIAVHIQNNNLNRKKIIIFSILGSIAIWFSHPAIFVLSGVGISLLLINFGKEQRVKTISILAIFSSWILSFVVFYFVSLRHLSSSKGLLTSWKAHGAFPSSSFDIIWMLDSLGRFFSKPLGFTIWVDGIAIIAFVAGCISLFSTKKATLFILVSPVFTTFFASYLHKYPFEGRLVLFLAPLFILIIAEGSDYIINRIRDNKFYKIVGVIVLVLLLTPPLINASNIIVKPTVKEEIKPVISYIKTHQKPEDILYIFQRGEHQFKYYAKRYGYQEKDYIIGVDDLDKYDGVAVSDEEWNRYKSDLDKLRGKNRVWFLFSHVEIKREHEMIKSYLDSIGKQIIFFKSPGSFVYLYDLT